MKWNKIYRGGVHRTTPETREVKPVVAGTVQPGQLATLTAAGEMAFGVGGAAFFYIIGEPMYGSVDDILSGANADTVRMYSPRSGDLYAARCVAGVVLNDDAPLTITTGGLLKAAGVDDVAHCYVDNPASAHPRTLPATTTASQLVPVKIK